MMSIAEVISITGATLLQGEREGQIAGISTDSRTLRSGELFIALRGERYDGHDFLPEALRKGAAAALASRFPEKRVEGCVLLVKDTLAALGNLAANWRRRFQLPVIAITGSVGKTTTKEMLASILSQAGETLKTPENYNNEIGVPLTALRLSPGHGGAVFELAMRGRGQIRYLAEIISPTIGVITNIGLSHLEFLSSPVAIAATKAELLEVIGKDGLAVLNKESEHFPFLKEKAERLITFGLQEGDVHAADVQLEGDGVRFRLWLPREVSRGSGEGEWLSVRLSVSGKHNVANALAAAAAARCAGASTEQIVHGLQAFRAVSGRMRVLKAAAGFTLIDDTYNASPDSMRAALEVLADLPGERKIAVLGEMRELGQQSLEFHREIGRLAGRISLALLVAVGELGREIAAGVSEAPSPPATQCVPDAGGALEALGRRGILHKGDVVLVKASRALGLEAVVKGLMVLSP